VRKRHSISKGKSRSLFQHTAMKVHPFNFRGVGISRGGTRL